MVDDRVDRVDDYTALMRELHEQHAPALWRYVVHLTNDRAFAEDVVQETLFRAWQRADVLQDAPYPVRAWLFTVARNLVTDDRRSARARREVGTDRLPEHDDGDQTDALLDSWLIADALSGLSRQHREVIVHCYYGGLTIAEVALRLEIPEGTVKSRLHFALRGMRLALQEKGVTR